MLLKDKDRELVEIGTFPVLIQKIDLSLKLHLNYNKWILFRLNLRGQIVEKTVVSSEKIKLKSMEQRHSFYLSKYNIMKGAK